MKLYLLSSNDERNGEFPVYQPFVDQRTTMDAKKDNGDPSIYEFHLVNDVTPDYNPTTHRLGAYSIPVNDGDGFTAKRAVIKRKKAETDESDRIAWEDVRIERNAQLMATDTDVLRLLEGTLVGADDLKEYRQSLRDVTDPSKNGGKSDPNKIKLPKKP